MPRTLQVALVGDHDPAVTAHRAIPRALALAAGALGVEIDACWIATPALTDPGPLRGAGGIWCVPASPYRHADGALEAIRHAREAGIPFLGTCGGFQHALVEYARNVLGWADADHAETASPGRRLVVTALACSLVEVGGEVRFAAGSRLHAAYGAAEATEGYHCSYGMNPALRAALLGGALRATAFDAPGEVRGVELTGHPFFVATLFQPERAALEGRLPPPVRAFVEAALAHAG